MTSNSLYPLISKPTRITSSTAILIDNIFTNNLELNMNSGILYTDLSDHRPVFQVTHLKMIVEPPRQKRFVRLINSTTTSAFRSRLEDVDWSSVYTINSVNESYDTFSSLLTSAYSMSFPLQPACSKPHRSSKPWFSNGLFTSCKRKNSLYKQFQLNPTALNKLRYNKYRNKYNFLIKLASHKDLATLTRMVNQELSHVSSWFNANKLTVHPDKSKFIIFHPRRKQINPSELNILRNNTPIARVQEHKFLGIIIHKNLSWKPHITSICDKVAKVIGILSKSRRYLPSFPLKTLRIPSFYLISTIVTSSGHLHMPPALNPSIYSKRKPFRLSPFLLQELVQSLFS